MKKIEGSVTAAKGFLAAGTEAGIKYQNRKDMAMIYSEVPCILAGTFTTNLVKAAPVLWDKKIVKESPYGQAVVINSGIANACTGKEGFAYCEKTAQVASEVLHIPESSVLCASTGVIGMQIPFDKLEAGIRDLSTKLGRRPGEGPRCGLRHHDHGHHGKRGSAAGGDRRQDRDHGGMSKGSGMIHPNMCTMLAFVTTDVDISKELLQEAVSDA